jgi:signal transduction histidine kinase
MVVRQRHASRAGRLRRICGSGDLAKSTTLRDLALGRIAARRDTFAVSRGLVPGWLRTLRGASILAAFAASTAVVLALTSDHLGRPVATGLYKGWIAAAPILIGALWYRRRPSSALGGWLIALGVAAWGVALQSSNLPLIYAIGAMADAPLLILTFLVCLSFPTGRLQTTLDRTLVWLTVILLTVFYLPRLVLLPQFQGGGALSQCVPDCPVNVLFITAQPGIVEVIDDIRTYGALAIAATIFVVFIVRLVQASPPRRRTRLAVAVSSLLFLPAFIAFHTARAVLEVDRATLEDLGWVLVAARVIFPLGFLAALLEADLFAGRAFRRLLAQLALRPTPERWRDAVADAMGDPSLRLAYWEPSMRRYREPDGAVLHEQAAHHRTWVPIDRDGEPVAAMSTDPVVAEDPELLDAASQATLIAVEHGHLETALQASMSRLVEAGDAERRRIQRDLHDSAQQRLVALRIHLGLAADSLGDRPETAVVQQLGHEVDAALDELRTVAHGLYPPVLAKRGVPDALRAAARSSPMPVRIADDGFGRQPAAVENAVYFCCLEALQNAAKHAGENASVDVRLASHDGVAHFSVADDGAGFDPASVVEGAGLSNIADRVAAAGGTLRIESAPAQGTRVRATLPT